MCRPSEVGGASFGSVSGLDPFGTVTFADVAKAALLGAGDVASWSLVCEPPDQRRHVGHEVGAYRGSGAADVGFGVAGLAAGNLALELLEGFGNGVLVDPDLGLVNWARPSGLGVVDEDLVVMFAYESGLPAMVALCSIIQVALSKSEGGLVQPW